VAFAQQPQYHISKFGRRRIYDLLAKDRDDEIVRFGNVCLRTNDLVYTPACPVPLDRRFVYFAADDNSDAVFIPAWIPQVSYRQLLVADSRATPIHATQTCVTMKTVPA
jgi:hypothetical protein